MTSCNLVISRYIFVFLQHEICDFYTIYFWIFAVKLTVQPGVQIGFHINNERQYDTINLMHLTKIIVFIVLPFKNFKNDKKNQIVCTGIPLSYIFLYCIVSYISELAYKYIYCKKIKLNTLSQKKKSSRAYIHSFRLSAYMEGFS